MEPGYQALSPAIPDAYEVTRAGGTTLAHSRLQPIMKLFATTMLPGMLCGCLYTERIVAVEEEPLSPSVGLNATFPPVNETVAVDPEVQTNVPFEILVIEEPNVDDTLRVRWFVDGFTTLYGEDLIEPCDLASTDCVRGPIRSLGDVGINLDVAAFGTPPVVGIHRVEAIITDKPWLTPPNDPVAGNRAPDPEANVHYLHWEVNVLP